MKSELKITIIIVLYKKTLSECISYRSLQQFMKGLGSKYDLIIYNNSSELIIEDSTEYILVNSDKNGKLPQAYNYGLQHAQATKNQWLLLLDQDTEVSAAYFQTLEKELATIDKESTVAVVPKLIDGHMVLSPRIRSAVGYWEKAITHTGYQQERVVAFNSMSLLSVSFMQSIGGFSENYPLDMLDHWYYNKIYKNRKKVYVLDCAIKHNLSFQHYEAEVSVDRHRGFLDAEALFVRELGKMYVVSYKIKLLLRAVKQFLVFKNKQYARLTLRKLIE